MADLNATVQFLTPYYSTVEQVVGTISLFVGGIFGIYLIALVVRFVFLKKILDVHRGIKADILRLEGKIDKLKVRKK
jgi:hypothetical protein|tara:strand:- start:273 stop:503 length:231 start_codon:yes stop_codon:yes gene_type:complete